jgi:hypothetical protein
MSNGAQSGPSKTQPVTGGYFRFRWGSIGRSARVRHNLSGPTEVGSQGHHLSLKTALKDARYRVEIEISGRVARPERGRDLSVECAHSAGGRRAVVRGEEPARCEVKTCWMVPATSVLLVLGLALRAVAGRAGAG